MTYQPNPYYGGPMAGPQFQPVPRPAVVDNAFWAWLVAMACSLAGMIVYLFYADEVQQQALSRLGPQGGELANSELMHQSMQVGKIVGGVFGVVLIGVWALFVIKMRAGRNWARITLLVISCVYGFFMVISLVISATGASMVSLPVPSTVLSVLMLLAVVCALVLMFRPAARAYFAQPR